MVAGGDAGARGEGGDRLGEFGRDFAACKQKAQDSRSLKIEALMSEQNWPEGTGNHPSTVPNSGPRDVFLHLLAIIVLYLGLIELLAMLFGFIELAFPGTSSGEWADPLGSIRFAVATLIIVFPVYIWAARFIVRDLAANPEKINFWTCRCPFYLTTFLGALVLIIDLIWLFYYFLGNQLAAPFLLKVAAVLLVIGAALFYYFVEIRQSPQTFSAIARRFAYPSALLVTICVIAGFIVSGPPMHQRFVRYDGARVADLKVVQDRILNYWHLKKVLPDDITAADNLDPASMLPNDPSTGNLYEYYTVNAHSFYLCSNFRTKSPTVGTWNGGFVYHGWGWEHDSGRSCYQRDVDSLKTASAP
ncbi:MAG TPA: DUF5671 domain-containing protein [Candidatus Binataceae bacterium]